VKALGLLLLIVSVAVALGVVLSNTDATSAAAFGMTVSNITLGGLFLAGVVTGLVFMLGLGLLVSGTARQRRRRIQAKHTVRGVRSEKEQLEEENAALRARLAEPYPTGEVPSGEGKGLFGRR
jgi:lipopolysaccharide export LptBFGC system permease protein LptF